MMRPLRPPPKVTPPRPPAHLFERDEVVPVKLDKKLENVSPAFDFEDDVKRQMQELENELKMLSQGQAPASNFSKDPQNYSVDDRDAKNFSKFGVGSENRVSQEPQYGHADMQPGKYHAHGPPLRINPADWKSKGFPSEFAYMKAMGQLEISSNKPPPNNNNMQPRVMPGQPPQQQLYPPQNQYEQQQQQQERGNYGTMEKKYEKEMLSPARRKGGAISHLYDEDEDLRRKAAMQQDYSGQLMKQVII